MKHITDAFEADAERQRELHRQIPKITSLIRSSSSEAKTMIEWHMMKFFPDSVVGILLSKALAEINAGEHEKGAVTLESIWPAPEPPRDGFSVPEEEIQLRHGVLTVDQKEEMYGQWEVQAGRLLTFANKPVATIHRDANQGGEPVVLDKLVRILAAHLNETRQTPDTIYKQAMRER